MSRHGVTHAFLSHAALKMLRTIAAPVRGWPLRLLSVASGGESLGRELIEWGRQNLNLMINEVYGQTECNMIVSSSATLVPPRIGRMGEAVPGHTADIVDAAGHRFRTARQAISRWPGRIP